MVSKANLRWAPLHADNQEARNHGVDFGRRDLVTKHAPALVKSMIAIIGGRPMSNSRLTELFRTQFSTTWKLALRP
jgi:hypothetical protein